ncbi:MAG: transcriptional regulator NrdR [Oscillospiraceae bacterium]|nr:transcriptional regulator NrdR [Oscillospiraceae bacterium]
MKCPFCGYSESRVVDSRPTDDGERIRRRRECLSCQRRFTTYEVIETTPMMVIKKDGSLEAFDRGKLLNSMLRACEKRQVSLAQIEQAVGEIEQSLQNTMQQELSTTLIGEMAMDKLKLIDEAAYVRFASVYRQFKDINSFMDELKKILETRE